MHAIASFILSHGGADTLAFSFSNAFISRAAQSIRESIQLSCTETGTRRRDNFHEGKTRLLHTEYYYRSALRAVQYFN